MALAIRYRDDISRRTTLGNRVRRSRPLCLLFALTVIVSTSAWVGARRSESTVHLRVVEMSALTRLRDIPSHNRIYRASLVLPSTDQPNDSALAATVLVRTSGGMPVANASLTMDAWMPDSEQIAETRPRTIRYLGEGKYRVEGLRLTRSGWWNIALHIAGAAGTDSLAFNVEATSWTWRLPTTKWPVRPPHPCPLCRVAQ